MKDMKLKPLNKMKYCINCREVVEINIKGLSGFCLECNKRLFTMSKENQFQ